MWFGTSRIKVRTGCEPNDSLKDGPFRAIRRYLSGIAGTQVREVREGREKVKRLQRETRKPESADAGECVWDSQDK
ncbi:hypothetical protein KI387_029929, partial [Taxus chinensis]